MLKVKLSIIILSSIINSISLNTLTTYDSFCEGRIIEYKSSFSANDINTICSYISGDDRFILRFIDQKFIDPNLYQRDNREFFGKHCHNISLRICKEGFGISIYNNDIYTISIYSQILNDFEKIKAMSIEDIEVNSNNVINSQNVIRIVQRLQQIQSNSSDSNSHTIYDENEKESTNTSTRIDPLMIFIIIIIPMFFVCFVISSLMRLVYMPEPTVYSPLYIHEHLNKIKELYYSFDNSDVNLSSSISSSKSTITSNKCFICFGEIIMQISKMCFEMKDMSSKNKPLLKQSLDNIEMPIDTANIRFCCGHVYHASCLHNKNIKLCLMCQDDEGNNVDMMLNTIANKKTTQIIMKRHIIRFILNFNLLYEQHELEHHAKVYKNELHNLREKIIRQSL